AIFEIATLGVWVGFLVVSATDIARPHPLTLVVFWIGVVIGISLTRAVARGYVRSRSTTQRAVVLGAGAVGQSIARRFIDHPEYGIDVVGFVDSDPREKRVDLDHVPVLGP